MNTKLREWLVCFLLAVCFLITTRPFPILSILSDFFLCSFEQPLLSVQHLENYPLNQAFVLPNPPPYLLSQNGGSGSQIISSQLRFLPIAEVIPVNSVYVNKFLNQNPVVCGSFLSLFLSLSFPHFFFPTRFCSLYGNIVAKKIVLQFGTFHLCSCFPSLWDYVLFVVSCHVLLFVWFLYERTFSFDFADILG